MESQKTTSAKTSENRARPDLGMVNPPMIEVQLRDLGRNFKTVVAQSYHDLADHIDKAVENVINRFPWQQAIEEKLTKEIHKMVDYEIMLTMGDNEIRAMLRERIAKFVKDEIEVWRKFNPEAKL